jgi:RimJ/RimL family protein N-acetyltransferase
LRPIRHADFAVLAEMSTLEGNEWGFFGFRPSNARERRYAENGLISDDHGALAIETTDGTLVGDVSWIAVVHGPSTACQALNIGISLLREHRGRGYGTAAQAALADYLFAYTLVERLEASTDIDNVAEQRALVKAGFTREGVLRHAQYRAGQWRDTVLYSRLRGDPAPVFPG